MTTAPSHPPVHAYEGESPYDLVDSKWGRIERWRANAMATGEASAAVHIRNDAVEEISGIQEQKRQLAAGFAALALAKASFDTEKRAFADQAVTLAGRLSVEWDRVEKLRADQHEEPLASPPGTERSKEPEPSLELEDTSTTTSGTVAGVHEDQTEVPEPGLPHPPVVAQPIAAGLDESK